MSKVYYNYIGYDLAPISRGCYTDNIFIHLSNNLERLPN